MKKLFITCSLLIQCIISTAQDASAETNSLGLSQLISVYGDEALVSRTQLSYDFGKWKEKKYAVRLTNLNFSGNDEQEVGISLQRIKNTDLIIPELSLSKGTLLPKMSSGLKYEKVVNEHLNIELGGKYYYLPTKDHLGQAAGGITLKKTNYSIRTIVTGQFTEESAFVPTLQTAIYLSLPKEHLLSLNTIWGKSQEPTTPLNTSTGGLLRIGGGLWWRKQVTPDIFLDVSSNYLTFSYPDNTRDFSLFESQLGISFQLSKNLKNEQKEKDRNIGSSQLK